MFNQTPIRTKTNKAIELAMDIILRRWIYFSFYQT